MPENVEALNVTQNGTYTAQEGHGYSPVTINVDVGIEPDDFADGSVKTSVTGDITLSTATKIADYAFNGFTGITSITAPEVTQIYGLSVRGCSALTSFIAPKLSSLASEAFKDLTNLVTVTLSNIRTINNLTNIFRGCTKLKNVSLPNLNFTYSQGMFYECTDLEYLVLPKNGMLIGSSANNSSRLGSNFLYGCSKLKAFDLFTTNKFDEGNTFKNCTLFDTLIIRATAYQCNSTPALTNINSFDGTPFASGGSGGTLYVPSRIISWFQNATNWSTILGYENNQILPIEGSYYETHYADGSLVPIPTYTEISFTKASPVQYTTDGNRSTGDTRYWGSQSYVETNGTRYYQLSFLTENNSALQTSYFCCQFFKDDQSSNKEYIGYSTDHYWSRRVIDNTDTYYYTVDITLPEDCTAIRFSSAYIVKDTAKLYSVSYS